MRRTPLIANATLECGHVVRTQIKHNVKRALCVECGEQREIVRTGLYRAKCVSCQFAAQEPEQREIGKRAGWHANAKGHCVEIFNPSEVMVSVVAPSAQLML